MRGWRGLLGCRHSILRHRLSILSCRHSIQDHEYRSIGLFGGYFGIPKLPAFNSRPRIPKYWLVWRLLRYSHAAGRACSSCIYRSIGLFGGYFGIHTPPAGQTHAEFTEVLACWAPTSVYAHRRQGLLKLHLPKYWLVWRLLRYSYAAGRTNQCFKYRSFSLLGGYFGIRIPPAGQTHAEFTEVMACLAATSVFAYHRQDKLLLHLPK